MKVHDYAIAATERPGSYLDSLGTLNWRCEGSAETQSVYAVAEVSARLSVRRYVSASGNRCSVVVSRHLSTMRCVAACAGETQVHAEEVVSFPVARTGFYFCGCGPCTCQ